MTFKRFGSKDVVINTILSKPDVKFLIHSGATHYLYERPTPGDFSNNVKHVPSGHINLHELNINRPSDALIHPFIEKASTRYAWKTITTAQFDNFQFLYGDNLTGSYPYKASLSRIYTPAGTEFSSSLGATHANKRYVTALENPINFQNSLGSTVSYEGMGPKEVNMLCAPGIFCGSLIAKGTVELNYYMSGALTAKATDRFSDGRLIQVSGAASNNGKEIGIVLYRQGIMALTGSWDLHAESDHYLSNSSISKPKWTNFGTGLPQVGTQLEHGSVTGSSYSVEFKATNKVPSMTMYAYAKMSENNLSNNPTFTSTVSSSLPVSTGRVFEENAEIIAAINRSIHADYKDDYENVTYISKVGIYDKNKNLIAIATLANPIKKTEKRDFLVKMKLDF
jgi:hypothetical protein